MTVSSTATPSADVCILLRCSLIYALSPPGVAPPSSLIPHPSRPCRCCPPGLPGWADNVPAAALRRITALELYLSSSIPAAPAVPLAVGETSGILLQPPLPLAGVSIGMEKGCQQNDRTLADGQVPLQWQALGGGGGGPAPGHGFLEQSFAGAAGGGGGGAGGGDWSVGTTEQALLVPLAGGGLAGLV